MSHEHEPLTDGSPAATEPAPGEVEPAFLARARRILGGDVRPEDYLPVTPEVRAAADFEMVYIRDQMKREAAPEWAANQLRDWTLSFHCGGKNILYIKDDRGVVVVAVGLDQIAALVQNLPNKLLDGVTDGYPEPF